MVGGSRGAAKLKYPGQNRKKARTREIGLRIIPRKAWNQFSDPIYKDKKLVTKLVSIQKKMGFGGAKNRHKSNS